MKSADGGEPEAKPVAGPCPNAVATMMSPFGLRGVIDGALVTVDKPFALREPTVSPWASTPEVAAPAMSNNTIVVFWFADVSGMFTASVELVPAFCAYCIAGTPVSV